MNYYMMNKPSGYLTANGDRTRPTVMEFIPEELRGKIMPVGRLDMDTTGLLIFTDDGRLTPALMHPDRHVEKEYFFYAIGRLTDERIASLEGGVEIGPCEGLTKPAEYRTVWSGTVSDISAYLPERRRMKYLKNPDGPAFAGVLKIHEGKKHQVKLMLRAVDCKIVKLRRISVGGLRIDPSLPEGGIRRLTPEEEELITSYICIE